jgi:hypothetical protein
VGGAASRSYLEFTDRDARLVAKQLHDPQENISIPSQPVGLLRHVGFGFVAAGRFRRCTTGSSDPQRSSATPYRFEPHR